MRCFRVADEALATCFRPFATLRANATHCCHRSIHKHLEIAKSDVSDSRSKGASPVQDGVVPEAALRTPAKWGRDFPVMDPKLSRLIRCNVAAHLESDSGISTLMRHGPNMRGRSPEHP